MTQRNACRLRKSLYLYGVRPVRDTTMKRLLTLTFCLLPSLAWPGESLGDKTAFVGPGAVAADMFWDFEGGNGPISTAEARHQTKAAIIGAWSSSGADPNPAISFSPTTLGTLLHPITVNGTNYTGSGKTSAVIDQSLDAYTYLGYRFPATHDALFVSWLLKAGPTGFGTYDLLLLQSRPRDFCSCNWKANPSKPYLQAHSLAGSGAPIYVANNVTYRVQMRAERGQLCEIAVWRALDGHYLGTSSLPLRDHPIYFVQAPYSNAHGVKPPTFVYSDNYVWKWTGLLPAVTNLWP